ncbi:toxin-antitoxin system, toxin component, GNAT family [Aeromicrobium marinum DSM 15272]|uniref:Toxin-antitoxin system, toxin component, GNAT family n=1 Tax=Aeromicrobium marinum DSM 15272 TaxID=585531 RepID=E2SFY5_9ACTN|nr:toxin-antitoxin system, toxin component, GNAT family [Aeromicrobium marinum DSM 15272]
MAPGVTEPLNPRRAGEADFDELTDLWERSARSTHGFLADEDVSEMRPSVRDLLLPSMDVWVVDVDAEAAAFAGVRDHHVELLYVEPRHHGRGLGSRLLRWTAATTVEVYADNVTGMGFYRSHGFTETRRDPTDVLGRPFPIAHLARRSVTP